MSILNAALQRGKSSGATVAQVSFSESGGFGAVGESEQRSLTVCAPRGFAYRPCEGDKLLLIPADGAMLCAGVLNSTAGLEGGELRLSSAGGAVIELKNNGDIILNGWTITRAGEMISPQGKEG